MLSAVMYFCPAFQLRMFGCFVSFWLFWSHFEFSLGMHTKDYHLRARCVGTAIYASVLLGVLM